MTQLLPRSGPSGSLPFIFSGWFKGTSLCKTVSYLACFALFYLLKYNDDLTGKQWSEPGAPGDSDYFAVCS
jgi:hypothetical protein